MNTLSKHDIPKLEEYWIKHKENKRRLQFRAWELTEQREPDENTGSSSGIAVSKPTEQKAVSLADDILYNNLKTITKAIDRIYKESDDDLKTIVDMRYWDDDSNCYEWDEIADKLFMSRSKVLRKRNTLLDETAARIGWV